ncbi:hypothetical protein APHAL10511_002609 [Amanita phalloides]|nr:hypothetical protein APHAL10511_002609 [Amanita phalloides]
MEYDAGWCPVCDRQIIPKRLNRKRFNQAPIPLYCSDHCRLADFQLPPPESESDSIDSLSSSSSSASDPPHLSPSMATLAAIYNFPPPPPRPPVFEESYSSDSEFYHEYSSGIMMAGRFIDSVCPKPVKRAPYPFSQPPEPRKPVPGWSDGSNAWRASVYSFTSPRKVRDPSNTDETTKAYRSFAASPHRSHGIYSTLGDSAASTPRNVSSAASLPTAAHDLIQKYTQSFNRRSESRTSTHPGSIPTSPTSTHSFPATKPTSQRRERPIVQRGAEGRLLVPDVKLKVHSGSSTSLSSAWSGSAFGSRKSVHSPLSMASSDSSDDDTGLGTSRSPMVTAKRPAVETRSWSYDNIKTYPIMQLPPKKEKQIRKQIVDGREVEVEVEVEVEPTLKRLFLFSPSQRQA